MKQRKRIAAFVLAAAMVFSTLPLNVLAVEPPTVAGGLCEHHPEHTTDCGYTEGTEGTPCNHEHNEDCYTLVAECVHEHTEDCYPAESVSDNTDAQSDAEEQEPTACTHECSEESGCITKALDCHHEHDSECGYTEEVPGTPCTFVCEICNPQDGGAQEQCSCITLCTEGNTNLDCPVCGAENADLSQCKGKEADEQVKAVPEQVDALPTAEEVEAMTAEEQQAAYKKLQAAYAAYNALTEEQKAKITGAEKLDNLIAFFAGKTNALATINDVTYLDENGSEQTADNVTVVDSSMTEWQSGWYVVNSNITIDSRVTVKGEVHLILADGASLTVHDDINVAQGNSFTVYAQSAGADMGVLTVKNKGMDEAGIGGGSWENAGTITINGGNVTATGGSFAAGIGGGNKASGGTITINGGTITINGGKVTANGGNLSAGIGSGNRASSSGDITINGGIVTATGDGGAGIGGGKYGSGGSVTISGGNVTATGGKYGAAGIGAGLEGSDVTFKTGANGHALIFANGGIGDKTNQKNWSGLIFEGDAGTIYGKQNLTVKVTPASYKLTLKGEADSPIQVTLNEAVVEPANTGTTVTYGYNITNEALANWQTERVFSGLTANTTYYFFAKAEATTNHAKTISQGVAITTPKKSVSGIEIINQPANLSYTSGQTLDLSGLSVQVNYNDNTSETLTGESGKLTADPAQGTVLTVAEHNGKKIEINYGGKTAETSALTVGKAEQAALSIIGAPSKIHKGSSFTLQTSGGSGEGTITWSVVSGPATVDANGAVTVTDIGEFQIKAVKAEDAEYNQTEALITLTAEKKPSSGGGDSSNDREDSSDKDSTNINRPNKNDPNTPTTGQAKPVKPGINGNANINESTVQQAINKATVDAKKNGSTANGIAVVVPVNVGGTRKDVQIILKADTLDKLVSSKVKHFTIDTDSMTDFGFTLDTLKELNRRTSGDIVFKVKKTTVSSAKAKAAVGTRPAYDISLWEVKNGKETRLTNLNGKTISVAVPYTSAKNEQSGNLYAVSVDTAGKVQWLTKSSYDADQKAVIFQMTQAGIYGVGYDAKVSAFTDIENHWAKDNIFFVVSRGLLNGTSATTFSPNTGMTRGMFVTALGRLAGIDPADYQAGKFTDVKADAYYVPYVNWAASKGIVSGTTDTTFAPDSQITREQMAVILKNYAAKLGYTIPKTLEAVTFADNTKISSQVKEAVKSMQQAGILAGKTNNRFDPKGTATRAEVATVLCRFVEIIIDSQTANGWQQNDSGEWSYYKNGEPLKGWFSVDQKKYWLDKTTGKMFSNGWKQIDGKQYYFYVDGSMAVNTTSSFSFI